jgi:hypothetical protein
VAFAIILSQAFSVEGHVGNTITHSPPRAQEVTANPPDPLGLCRIVAGI